ncbi:hypothetical protein AURDEDRAFT_155316 [Auricularia subglabra TFB-10046 SS5]|nr:hypothetical protein AURDEDRAFT_155316 [Auricularia subglabra TFB-10046 SS5]
MPRDISSPPRTTRYQTAYAPYPMRPECATHHDFDAYHVGPHRPTRAARPRYLAELGDSDYDPRSARSPSPPSPPLSYNSRLPRSTTPPWVKKARRKQYDRAGTQKKVPNTFMMYKNDFHRRYPEICILERVPTQRMRIAANIWDKESPQVRGFYERRYRDAMIAAGRKFAEKDMNKRKKRTLNVTTTRRARKAAQGETLTARSRKIVEFWVGSLSDTDLIKAVFEWEETNSPSLASHTLRRMELQNMLDSLRDLKVALAEDPDQTPLDDSPPEPERAVEVKYSPPPGPPPVQPYYHRLSVSAEELPKPQPSFSGVVSPTVSDTGFACGNEPASRYEHAPGNYYVPPPQNFSSPEEAPRYGPAYVNHCAGAVESFAYPEAPSYGAVFHATGGANHYMGDSGYPEARARAPIPTPQVEMPAPTYSRMDQDYVSLEDCLNAVGYYNDVAPSMPAETYYQPATEEVLEVALDTAFASGSPALDPALAMVAHDSPSPPPPPPPPPPQPVAALPLSAPVSPTLDISSFDAAIFLPEFAAVPPSLTYEPTETRQASPGGMLKPGCEDIMIGQLDPQLLEYY